MVKQTSAARNINQTIFYRAENQCKTNATRFLKHNNNKIYVPS